MAKAAEAVKEKASAKNDSAQDDSKKQVQSVEFSEAADAAVGGAGASFDILLDMDVPVTVAIGRADIPVRRLLQLAPGSVLKLGKPIDEPIDLYLKDTKFATGDVVTVDDRFAVRIKQIIGAGAGDAAEA
jgi:flagellar motor switch protein FliN/FliY